MLGDTPILSYYVLNSFGIIAGFIVLFFNMKTFDSTKRNRTLLFAIVIFIPFIITSRLGSIIDNVILHVPACRADNMLLGSFSIWWGLGLSNLFAIPIARFLKVDLWETGDLFAPSIAVGGIFARFACLLNGCCFGVPSPRNFILGTFYPSGSYVYSLFGNVPIYPVQFFESFTWLIILIILSYRNKAKAFKGELIILLGFFYAIARFVIEFFRYHEKPGFPSYAQILSIIILIIAVTLWILKKKDVIK
jgi:phosphatidylglycerol:prolipoprotein diacylglycerol transferase